MARPAASLSIRFIHLSLLFRAPPHIRSPLMAHRLLRSSSCSSCYSSSSSSSSTSNTSSRFAPPPAPPRLPPDEQAIFESLLDQSSHASTSSTTTTPSTTTSSATTANTTTASDGDHQMLHRDMRPLIKPDFEGDVNPTTGEVGGPKNEPLRWGPSGDWSYKGRATDF